ncbi:MAG: hypothetical protein K0M70_03825 [Arenimonas sp.]|uniref:hypothetical protein n=1 Tax=Arenimonas sp. TaxID=1872635 RepID=UPI0025BA8A23|nr:hypothetical protein [Arenimonas sp.]MBW8366970.1 hypothetical protein [Arenimonas sp.]
MEKLRRFQAIVVADLRERTRALRFWAILAIVAALTWWCFPAAESQQVAVGVGAARARYSSAWAGLTLGLMYSTMLAWLGFYLVRGTLVRDFDSRVWQLLVATPMTRAGYLLAKWASHMVVFFVVLAVGLAVGVVAQWVRAEDRALDLVQMVKPVLVLTLPALALTAFFAIAFDMVPMLRRTGGNVLYFFVWLFLFAAMVTTLDPEASAWARQTALSDPSGITLVQRDMMQRLPTLAPGVDVDQMTIGMNQLDRPVTLFNWMHWSVGWGDLGGRALWVLVAMLATVALAPIVDWAAARTSSAKPAARPGRRLRWLEALLRPLESFNAGRLLASELRLMLRQRRLWWWGALLVCWGLQLGAPVLVQTGAVIVAWMISLDLFARSLLRERETGTAALVMTAPRASARLLTARTAAAVLVAVLSALPALVRWSLQSPPVALSLLVTALGVALAGLALAAVCRSPRPYELAMVFLAYLGVQGAGPLAFQLTTPTATAVTALVTLALAAVLMLSWPGVNKTGGALVAAA